MTRSDRLLTLTLPFFRVCPVIGQKLGTELATAGKLGWLLLINPFCLSFLAKQNSPFLIKQPSTNEILLRSAVINTELH